MANGGTTPALGIGTVALEFALEKGQPVTVLLTEVLYMPKLSANLLSVPAVIAKGYQVTFESDGCCIYKPDSSPLAFGHGLNGLIRLNVFKQPISMLATATLPIEIWHRRLGHLGYNNVRILSMMTTGMELASSLTPDHICQYCAESKQTATPSRKPAPRTTRKLELIHSDVGGPFTPQFQGGSKYYITFVDDYSRATWVYPIKKKSQVLPSFRKWKAMVENDSGYRIKRFRTDRGSEYANLAIQELLTESGIRWEPSVPYTPSQNSKAERVNRTLMERVRAMLLDSNLPKGMWAELINTAAYLKNRSPANSQDKTPFELWNEQRPNLSNLRIIGSIAYAHTPNQGRKKLDKRSQKYFLVGYEGSSIYRL